MNYFFNVKQLKLLFILLLILVFTACGGGNSTSTDEEPPVDNTTVTLSGKIIDGEISGATVFLDLNRDGVLDTDEPTAKSDGNGTFILTLTAQQKNHKNYLNKKAPIVIYGGVDIRTGEVFEDYLTAIREDSNFTNVTPLSTLIAETLGEELDNDVNNRLNNIDDKMNEIKENLASLLDIKKELLTKDPIELAKEGDVTLLDTSLQIHKIAQKMKKAMKKELKNLRRSILKSYRAMAKSLKKLKKSAVKSADTALLTILDDVFDDNELFDDEFKETVKEETKELSKDIQDFWSRNRVALSDEAMTTVLNNLEIIIVDANSSIVSDTEAPIITLLGSANVSIQKGSHYTDLGATAEDNKDGDITANIVVNNPVDVNTIGTYTITYNVKDKANNSAIKVQRLVTVLANTIVVVSDTTKPVITLVGSSNVSINIGSTYTDLGATAEDNKDGNLTANIVINNPVDISTIGTYTISYDVNDSTGNSAVQITRTVTVKAIPTVADTTLPIITLIGTDISLTLGDSYVDVGAIADDDVDGNITVNIVVHNPVDSSTIGTYTVTYDINDSTGNRASQVTRTVIINPVLDITNPILTLLGDANVTLIQGTSYSDAGATASDNIDGDLSASIVVVNPVDINTVGEYIVTYNVKDTANNSATEITRTVNVIETPRTAKENFDFLNLATFGATKQRVETLTAKGATAWINEQLALPYVPNMHLTKTINIAKQAEPTKYVASLENYLLDNDTVFNMSDASFNVRRFQMSAWFDTALLEPDQLRHRVAYALSQIVVASTAEPYFLRRAEGLAAYMDILTKNAFGNYRDLLLDITHSATMGLYLTYNGSKKEQVDGTTIIYPDENYAREIMQLFTIGLSELNIDGSVKVDANGNGIPTYTQTDVNELAKVFTGWDLQRSSKFGKVTLKGTDVTHPLEFTAEHHDMSAKTVLGTSIQAGNDGSTDIAAAIDILMAHPNIAPFVSKQLIIRLAKSNPSPAYVGRVATVFNDNGKGVKGDLKAVTRAILLDSELREEGAKKFKEPLLAYTQFLRAFNVKPFPKWRMSKTGSNDVSNAFYIRDTTAFLSQAPTRAFTVFNFYNNAYVPSDAIFKAQNWVAPELQIQTDSMLIAFNNKVSKDLRNNEKGHIFAKYGTLTNIDSWVSQNFSVAYSASGDKFLLDCTEEYAVMEAELESSVDGVFESFNSIKRASDTTKDANDITDRDRALLALIEHLDLKLTAGTLAQAQKDALFHGYKEVFYFNNIRSADNPKQKIYENIIARIIAAIVTSETYMVQ